MRARSRFKTLALPHLTAIYRLARQMAGPDRADDLTQETFLSAWAHFDQFDATTNCRAWLCRILRNTWISQWRKTRLELPVADIEDAPAEPWYDWERQRRRLVDRHAMGARSAARSLSMGGVARGCGTKVVWAFPNDSNLTL